MIHHDDVQYATDIGEAVQVGRALVSQNLIQHVTQQLDFENEITFYRFTASEGQRGPDTEVSSIKIFNKIWLQGTSWHSTLGEFDNQVVEQTHFREKIGEKSDFAEKTPHTSDILIDEHNCDLLDAVRPIKWTDPEAKVRTPTLI